MAIKNFFFNESVPDWTVLGINEQEFQRMGDWAFGPHWRAYPKNALADMWNKKHPTLTQIAGHDKVADSVRMICEEWKKTIKDHWKT